MYSREFVIEVVGVREEWSDLKPYCGQLFCVLIKQVGVSFHCSLIINFPSFNFVPLQFPAIGKITEITFKKITSFTVHEVQQKDNKFHSITHTSVLKHLPNTVRIL